jgi:hypothetical protein
MLPYCSCLEIKDSYGEDYKNVPQWHNCHYINERNKLIPIAERYAEENARTESGSVDTYRFTQIFSTKMDQLTKEYGLI